MALPQAFIDSLRQLAGFHREAFEQVHQSDEQVTSVRLNPGKSSIENLQLPIEDKIPWSTQGYYLSSRPSFTLDPLFHAGAYYVQEASSMFLEEAVRQTVNLSQPVKALDLCAAPGGKSTLLQSLLSAQSVLVSNEVIKTRVQVLTENITKWGAINVVVTNNDPKDFQRLDGYFDLMVVDAPCSGSGLFRKDPAAISEWSPASVTLCSQRQQRILADALPALKDEGILVYATCSYSKEEDEDICDWLAGQSMESCRLSIANFKGIIETRSNSGAYGYRFYPNHIKGEGFFIAVFKKKEQRVHHKIPILRSRQQPEKLTSKESALIKPYLKNSASLTCIRWNNEVLALPSFIENELKTLQSALYIKKAGVKAGTLIRNELIPDHELAVSTIMAATIPRMEVGKETALDYLRRGTIRLDAGATGWTLLTYRHLPLGWVKLLPGRVNNYYPKDWRILHK